jgi:ATP-dependent DNA helicase PIF1
MELSREQQIAFDKYVDGQNIFITGPGGTGKTALIKKIYEHAYRNYRNIHVTALTGCASVLLNCKAKTLHSWAGIGLGNGTTEEYILKIRKTNFIKQIWKQTDILVVDEVSMLSLKLFEMLNDIGKAIRNNPKPFGGIQLIFSGDFYQLPPVGNRDEPDTQRFCFESNEWNSVFHRDCQIQFVRIYRQTDDIYANILNQIREGKIKRRSNELLMEYVGRKPDPSLIIEPTKLFPTRNKVEQINLKKINDINAPIRQFDIEYLFDIAMTMTKEKREKRLQFTREQMTNELEYLVSNLICDKEIKLKIGVQVMCIVNYYNDSNEICLCNGSQGIIQDFCPTTGYPIVKFTNGIIQIMKPHIWESDKIPGIGVSQVPLILSWALTIHKSQGATLDAAEIDVGSGIFECGQTYVALSRVKNLDGLYLSSFDVKRIRINKKVQDFYETLTTYQKSRLEHEEVYVPLVIAEPIQEAIEVPSGNRFIEFSYVEAPIVEIVRKNV